LQPLIWHDACRGLAEARKRPGQSLRAEAELGCFLFPAINPPWFVLFTVSVGLINLPRKPLPWWALLSAFSQYWS
jgi:hypothetical protein